MPARTALVVEDHELLANTLQITLTAAGVPTEALAPRSASDVVAAVAARSPSLVLLDLDLGAAVGDGTVLIGPVVALGSPVLVVTGITDRTRIAAAVEAGASGYLVKSAPFEQLLAAVRDALAGRPVLSDAERFELLALLRQQRALDRASRAPFDRLSPREQQVLRALAEGRSVETIANQWVVSKTTVRTQVRAVLTKLDVGTQLAAVARARHARWLEEGGQPEG